MKAHLWYAAGPLELRGEPDDPPPSRRKRIGATTDSIALLANRGGKGVILEHDGAGIEAEVDAVGTSYLDDFGFDDAPDGLSIWEGRLDARTTNTPDYGVDYETELVGTYRDLTEAEWALLRETGTPWAYEPSDSGSGDT